MKNTHLLPILKVLKKVASGETDSLDPKPALRDETNFTGLEDNNHAAMFARMLADRIELHFSQVSALESMKDRGFEISPAHIHILRVGEGSGQLSAAYGAVIAGLELNECYGSAPDFPDVDEESTAEQDGVREFLNEIKKFADQADRDVAAFLAKLAETATSQKLREVAPSILAALKADGGTLAEAVRKSKAFNQANTLLIDLYEKSGLCKKTLEVHFKNLDEKVRTEAKKTKEDLEKLGVNWKVAAAGIGGLILGGLLLRRR